MLTRPFIASFLLSVVLTIGFAVVASHNNGLYPNRTTGDTGSNNGLMFMSKDKNYSGVLYISTNNCNEDQRSAFQKVKNSTTGTTEMSRWTAEISMSEQKCDGTMTSETDMKVQHLDPYISSAYPNHGTEGGENHPFEAPPEFCDAWSVPYPCGRRPTVHINLPKWNTTSSTGRQRLIMHETGHSQGLAHHCSGDAIMNDGSSSCNSSRWTQVMSYQATDRTGVSNIYP